VRLNLAEFARPSTTRSLVQLITTLAPFVGLWWLMAETTHVSWLLTWLLAIPAGGLLFRLFMFQHDCGHGSFFRSRLANEALGSALGVLSLIPFQYWRRTHALHHVNSSNLDERHELGSLMTLTVREYEKLGPAMRFFYRLYRNPLVMCGLGAPFQLQIKHRFPWDTPRTWRKEWMSVLVTNVLGAFFLWLLAQFWGWGVVLRVEVPILLVTGWGGVWMIYIQHVFPDGYFVGKDGWNLEESSLRGSSYYQLPRLLRWITADVGVHHVHHYCQQIPNYRLHAAMEATPELQVKPLTLGGSWRAWDCKLWDEDRQQFVGFPERAAS
jgi:omega-6 fatty acid desaturase (delta-12 desaturase)